MNLPKMTVFSLEKTIPIKTCQTISKGIFYGTNFMMTLYSLAKDTNISVEFYDDASLFIVIKGKLEINEHKLSKDESFIANENTNRGVVSVEDSIYLEMHIKEGLIMESITKGVVFQLKDCIDYVEGGISNVDLVKNSTTKIVLMAFDQGEKLPPHTAPIDALIFALEGEAIMTVGEKEFVIKAGEQIIFPKDIKHNVAAVNSKFKMALILAK